MPKSLALRIAELSRAVLLTADPTTPVSILKAADLIRIWIWDSVVIRDKQKFGGSSGHIPRQSSCRAIQLWRTVQTSRSDADVPGGIEMEIGGENCRSLETCNFSAMPGSASRLILVARPVQLVHRIASALPP